MLIIGCRNDGNTSNGLTRIPRSSDRPLLHIRNNNIHNINNNNIILQSIVPKKIEKNIYVHTISGTQQSALFSRSNIIYLYPSCTAPTDENQKEKNDNGMRTWVHDRNIMFYNRKIYFVCIIYTTRKSVVSSRSFISVVFSSGIIYNAPVL